MCHMIDVQIIFIILVTNFYAEFLITIKIQNLEFISVFFLFSFLLIFISKHLLAVLRF